MDKSVCGMVTIKGFTARQSPDMGIEAAGVGQGTDGLNFGLRMRAIAKLQQR